MQFKHWKSMELLKGPIWQSGEFLGVILLQREGTILFHKIYILENTVLIKGILGGKKIV
jgi:hypothetical protein